MGLLEKIFRKKKEKDTHRSEQNLTINVKIDSEKIDSEKNIAQEKMKSSFIDKFPVHGYTSMNTKPHVTSTPLKHFETETVKVSITSHINHGALRYICQSRKDKTFIYEYIGKTPTEIPLILDGYIWEEVVDVSI